MSITSIKESITSYFPCEHDKREQSCCKVSKISNLQISNKRAFEDKVESLKQMLCAHVQTRMDALRVRTAADVCGHRLGREMDEILRIKVQQLVKIQKPKNLEMKESDDLREIFEEMWKDATGSVMRQVRQQDKDINIRAKVERQVLQLLEKDNLDYLFQNIRGKRSQHSSSYFEVQDYHLKLKGIRETKNDQASFKTNLTNQVKAGIKKIRGYQISRADCEKLQNETQQIISAADNFHISTIKGKEFVEKDAENLFIVINNRISAIQMDIVRITDHYRVELLIHITDREVHGFEKLHELYRKKSSPKAKLERRKESHFAKFEHEMGRGNLAVDLCNKVLVNMIAQNIEDMLSNSELLRKLQGHRGYIFTDLRTLQASIMADLYKADNFEKYCRYVSQYETTVKEKLALESIDCLEKNDLLKNMAKSYLEKIIGLVDEALTETVEGFRNGDNFFKTFFEHLSQLWIPHEELSGYYTIEIENKNAAKQLSRLLLQQLGGPVSENILKEIEKWKVEKKLQERNLTSFLFTEVVGCTQRCPFCKTPCDIHPGGRADNSQHSATLHRPAGLGGTAWSPGGIVRNDLTIETCPANVASELNFWHGEPGSLKSTPFKKYISVYPVWRILPNADFHSERFWKYVYAKFNKEWAEYYNAKPAKLDELEVEWRNYSFDDFREEMKDCYHSMIDF